MARSKADVTKNIRKKIVGAASMSLQADKELSNLEISKTPQDVSSHIEPLSQKNTDDSPRGIREVIGARHGINPLEVREKGLLRAGFSNLNRKVFGGSYNPPESIEPPAKDLKEKTRDNLRGVEGLEKIMKSVLTEVSVIRKVIEGRIKFDPKSKGYKDPDTGKYLGKGDVRRAGEGLYTKEEVGKQLGLSDAEIKKTKLADL